MLLGAFQVFYCIEKSEKTKNLMDANLNFIAFKRN
jgi:hypothetical protein